MPLVCTLMYIFVIFKLCLCMVMFISRLALGMANLRKRWHLDAKVMKRGIRMFEARLSKQHVAGVFGVSQSTVATCKDVGMVSNIRI